MQRQVKRGSWKLNRSQVCMSCCRDSIKPRPTIFSKSVLDIRMRFVVTVEPETKWMPNSDSASKLMPKWKILGQYDLLNYFYSCLKIAVFWDFYMASPYRNELGGKVSPDCFHMESPYNSWKICWFLNGLKKSVVGPNNLKICILA